MAIFVIGGTGSMELWEVDTDGGTVRPLVGGEGANGIDKEYLDTVQAMRRNGFAVVKGVDFAVAVPGRAELTSRQFSENG